MCVCVTGMERTNPKQIAKTNYFQRHAKEKYKNIQNMEYRVNNVSSDKEGKTRGIIIVECQGVNTYFGGTVMPSNSRILFQPLVASFRPTFS